VPYLRGYGSTRFLSDTTFRNGQQAALATDIIDFMDALNIPTAVIGGFDWGARTADIVAAVWPQRAKALVSVSGYLIVNLEANQQPLPPQAELGWWYQYYFATDRGVRGYRQYTHDFNKLIWHNASPTWKFDDTTYDRTAAAFTNPDHVDIVIHNYRWRLKLAQGEPRYDDLDAKLAAKPVITVPTITIGSDFDGPAKDGASYRQMFTGKYSHKVLDGIGHNVPQEAPQDFANAIIEVDSS
jgi:pimeloyl-ACP methyl ester carboxylesterase